MMKKFFMAALIALGIGTASSNAQVPAQLTLGYGGYTQMDASDMHDGWHKVNNASASFTHLRAHRNGRNLVCRLWRAKIKKDAQVSVQVCICCD